MTIETDLSRQLSEFNGIRNLNTHAWTMNVLTSEHDLTYLKSIKDTKDKDVLAKRPLISFNMKMPLPGSAAGTSIAMSVKMPIDYPSNDQLQVTCNKGLRYDKEITEKLTARQAQQLSDDVEDYMVSELGNGVDAVKNVANYAPNRAVMILSE